MRKHCRRCGLIREALIHSAGHPDRTHPFDDGISAFVADTHTAPAGPFPADDLASLRTQLATLRRELASVTGMKDGAVLATAKLIQERDRLKDALATERAAREEAERERDEARETLARVRGALLGGGTFGARLDAVRTAVAEPPRRSPPWCTCPENKLGTADQEWAHKQAACLDEDVIVKDAAPDLTTMDARPAEACEDCGQVGAACFCDEEITDGSGT